MVPINVPAAGRCLQLSPVASASSCRVQVPVMWRSPDMAEKIRIVDLAQPVYTEAQRAALDWSATLQVDLTRESILAEASATVGMDDFGPDDFLPRLDLLLDEWNSDQGLTNLARMSLRNKLVQHLTSRLLIQDQWNRHPEILDVPVERPIIVAGLPRSGTTHLLNLMAADQRLRSLPLWESYEPVSRPGEAVLPDGTDPRYQRCDQAWQSMQQVTPLTAAMHPMEPDHIHEELELMGPNIGSYNYEWLSHSPRWRDHYYAEDQTEQYEYMKNVLRLLTWQQRDTDRPTRWVLKCPQHLEQLPVLNKVFPDATVAITHRDPVAVIQSAITMLGYGQRINRKRVELRQLLEYWTDRVEHLLCACVADRAIIPPERSIDVPFHEFMADDLAMVRRIFDRAALPLDDPGAQALRDYLAAHPRGRFGQVVYDLKADFGVDPRALRERFRFYFDAFPVQAED